MQPAVDDWQRAEFAPPEAGAYRVTITGTGVETVEDAIAVAEISATDM
jgi:hypothetical protein